MSSKRAIILTVFAFGCFGGLLCLEEYQPLAYSRLKNIYRDTIARVGRLAAPNPSLVFLAIDSNSVGLDETVDLRELYGVTESESKEGRALMLMSRQWPWSREIYGLVLERLVEAGAKVIVFDLTFPTASENDAPFRAALDRYKDHVVIGSNFSATSLGSSASAATLSRPPDTLIPQTPQMDDRVAYTNFWPDEDEVVRRAQYRITFEQLQGQSPEPGSQRFLSLGAAALTKAGLGTSLPPEVDAHAFRYTAPPRQGFPPHSIFEIFVPEYWSANYGSGTFFKNKIVIVGAEGNWQHDEHPTPLGSMPGPEVHLNAINAVIHHEFIDEMPKGTVMGLAAAAGIAAIVLSFLIRSPWLRLLALLAADAAAGGIALLVFNRASVFVPLVAPCAELNFTVLLALVSDFASERLEKNRVRRTLEKYVSRNVVRELLDKPKLYADALGGVVKPVCVLFSDIRGYSSVSARTDPQALVTQLNEYLTVMVDCVFRHGGTLDKFIGDAVMAVWGNTHSEGVREDAVNAVRSALAMKKELEKLNENWRGRDLPELKIGIALNHGEVVVGNIGSPQRMEFTVIGDAVNVSWKLQELTKQIGSDVIVSKAVASLVLEHFDLRPLGTFRLHGMQGDFEIFAIARPVETGDQNISEALAAQPMCSS
ncbi:MAG: adenylate/guanylate cyclase domain-containing protein [Verrucomicrobiota bacterium]